MEARTRAVMNLNNVYQDTGNQGWDNPPFNDAIENPEGVGVYVSQWDETVSADALWRPSSATLLATVISHHTPDVGSAAGGVVISPRALVVRCGFSGEGGGTCPPLNGGLSRRVGSVWCEDQRDWRRPPSEPWLPTAKTASFPRGDAGCAYARKDLHSLTRQQASEAEYRSATAAPWRIRARA